MHKSLALLFVMGCNPVSVDCEGPNGDGGGVADGGVADGGGTSDGGDGDTDSSASGVFEDETAELHPAIQSMFVVS